MPTTIPTRKSDYRTTLLEHVLVLIGRGSMWYTCYAYPYDQRECNASIEIEMT